YTWTRFLRSKDETPEALIYFLKLAQRGLHAQVRTVRNDYSRYTWTRFLRSKDETPEALIDFLKLAQRGHHAQVRTVRNDKGKEILNKTLHAYFAQEGIEHQTSVARTPEQNDVVERW
ncbi:putative ribonuclease H-like domain-containing protein, partial [Tanacetum coccineum]